MEGITMERLLILKKEKTSIVVDVREYEEFKESNIGGINVPSHLLKDHISEIILFKKIIVVCSDGLRSSIMARVIEKKIPAAKVYNLTKGIFDI